ncbi:type I phosphomannose isomerase catalytic subunit [Flavobacterium sp.]|uniref:type I phosphomannose isomerase catalytic subunit n=1 Tax=Flavobacterium sp. TaxID=239 RepID=UPI0028BF405C|nr:type I phosphomannose isomerase catalytic subunit [Flavobacterium sp.]
MHTELYPLIFKPILKDRIWGGTKLKSLLQKDTVGTSIGESWEISSVPGDVSLVANGTFKGLSLNELLSKFPSEILGRKVYEKFGSEFPLLFKFLDAKEDLSIQLHPNDELAMKRHNSFGKTEMWYVMQADLDARIIVGFNEKETPDSYLLHLENKTLPKILKEIPVKKGDVFFLETGTIHAIGAGIVIAEIQQTSDITYRIYDWDRVDANGNSRELHIDLALEAINYEVINAKKRYSKEINRSNPAVICDYFSTNVVSLDGQMFFDKNGESFTVLVCTEGTFEISLKDCDSEYSFSKGDTVLLPSVLRNFKLIGKATVLEIFIS